MQLEINNANVSADRQRGWRQTRQKKSDDQDHQNDNMWADPTIAIRDANKSKMDDQILRSNLETHNRFWKFDPDANYQIQQKSGKQMIQSKDMFRLSKRMI